MKKDKSLLKALFPLPVIVGIVVLCSSPSYSGLSGEAPEALHPDKVTITSVQEKKGHPGVQAVFFMDASPDSIYCVLKNARLFP